jgi:hypothetical protein
MCRIFYLLSWGLTLTLGKITPKTRKKGMPAYSFIVLTPSYGQVQVIYDITNNSDIKTDDGVGINPKFFEDCCKLGRFAAYSVVAVRSGPNQSLTASFNELPDQARAFDEMIIQRRVIRDQDNASTAALKAQHGVILAYKASKKKLPPEMEQDLSQIEANLYQLSSALDQNKNVNELYLLQQARSTFGPPSNWLLG